MKHLYQLVYLAPHPDDKTNRIEIEEFVLAESWQQARTYWAREFEDRSHEILLLRKSVTVLAICPEAIFERYGQPTKETT